MRVNPLGSLRTLSVVVALPVLLAALLLSPAASAWQYGKFSSTGTGRTTFIDSQIVANGRITQESETVNCVRHRAVLIHVKTLWPDSNLLYTGMTTGPLCGPRDWSDTFNLYTITVKGEMTTPDWDTRRYRAYG